jgi:predicted ATPase
MPKKEPHNVVFIDRGIPDVLAYMHLYYDSYPASFDAICRGIPVLKFSYYHHGKKY